jgi:hypothetical protein
VDRTGGSRQDTWTRSGAFRRSAYDADVSALASDGIPGIDLHEVEDAVCAAIRSHDESALRLLGHGEVSIVLGWPSSAPEHALKRVPPFRSIGRAETYVRACEQNFEILRAAGVGVWPTTLHLVERGDGRAVVYQRQPIADTALMGVNVLRAAAPSEHHPFLEAVVVATKAVVSDRVGFDINAANWLWDGETATQIDFSSPFLLDDRGTDLLFDTSAFLGEYPAAMRPLLKRELLKLIRRFTTVEGALNDMVSHFYKERLDQWVEPMVTIAREHGHVLDVVAAKRMLDDDAKLMPMLLKVKRAQRWWVQHTRRTYDSLLPAATTYDIAAARSTGSSAG